MATLDAMIRGWSRDQKLEAMELIWRELSAEADSLASPEWHEHAIADRLANPAAGKALPLDDAKAEIKEAIRARRAAH
jgi:hypothetical protein